jgi:hypothetical protein
VRGVIFNVPPNNNEEELLSLLSSQGVKKVGKKSEILQRSTKQYYDQLPHGHLYFSTTTPPREVVIAHKVFIVKK